MKEAQLYEVLSSKQARCQVCPRRCIIAEGKFGYCHTRVNKEGKIFSIIYGRVASLAVSPIEKKPMFHFYPGSLWLSLGTYGCNFRCPGCQNWELAHAQVEKEAKRERIITPPELIEMAITQGCLGISWTYNEPAIWLEYIREGAEIAKAKGLLTNIVTNGYITKEGLYCLGPFLDSFRMDLKGFSKKTYAQIAHIEDFTPILNSAEQAKVKWGMHVEIITNVISGINDDEKELKSIALWIKDTLGPETPWHLTRFFPHYQLAHLPPTPLEVLEKGRRIGLEAGLLFVYLGNVPGHEGENTYCPKCQSLLIRRWHLTILENHLRQHKCKVCGFSLPGRF
ncbi:MAG: AmmeMemoRadiSam system radical SAM enzyme [Thermodesulfobacteriota bacterium]